MKNKCSSSISDTGTSSHGYPTPCELLLLSPFGYRVGLPAKMYGSRCCCCRNADNIQQLCSTCKLNEKPINGRRFLLFFIDIRAEPMATCGAIARQVVHRLRPGLLCYMLPPSCIAHSCRLSHLCICISRCTRAASIFPGVRGVHFVSMDCVNFYLIARPAY